MNAFYASFFTLKVAIIVYCDGDDRVITVIVIDIIVVVCYC